MDIQNTLLPGCLRIQPRIFGDRRGRFVKILHEPTMALNGVCGHFAEIYYSTSAPGVIRGLHFQTPPSDHAKLVYCLAGRILDVAVDLRVGSPTHGRHVGLELSAERGNGLYVPRGMAHGLCVLGDQWATVAYVVETVYDPARDTGIRWDSCGIDWPVSNPIVSERDSKMVPLAEFQSPFRYAPAV